MLSKSAFNIRFNNYNLISLPLSTNNITIIMKNKLFFTLFVALFSFAGFTACEEEDKSNTIYDVLKGDSRFSQLVAAIDNAGLKDALSADGTMTIFAPTDAAFTGSSSKLNGLTTAQLAEILQYHVLGSVVASTSLQETQAPEALAGGRIYIDTRDAALGVVINGQTNRTGDQTIGAVLTALEAVTHGRARVVEADIEADNGIVHVIDNVLLPDSQMNLLEAASKRYFIDRAVVAVVAAGLATANSPLISGTNHTLFAPINPPNQYNADAFGFIDVNGVDLTADPAALQLTLNLHIGLGNLSASTIRSTGVVSTLANPGTGAIPLTVADDNGKIVLRSAGIPASTPGASLFNARIEEEDIVCKNGTMHLINNLLFPQAPSAGS